jgi:hypothetical protein
MNIDYATYVMDLETGDDPDGILREFLQSMINQ